jgi:hypothetical protein
MSPAQVEGRLIDGPLRRIGRRGRVVIIGDDPRIAAPANPLDQAADRALREVEFRGDLRHRLSFSVPPPDGVPQGDGSGPRHRRSPMPKPIVLDKLQHKRSSSGGQT